MKLSGCGFGRGETTAVNPKTSIADLPVSLIAISVLDENPRGTCDSDAAAIVNCCIRSRDTESSEFVAALV